MTSKRLFLKAMAEEMRHRLWMLALSVLGHFLILFVPFLIVRSNPGSWYGTKDIEEVARNMVSFIRNYVTVAGGVIAILGAMVVGIFGFRFIFHKRHVDTWHSLPIRRSMLYGVCWLDGFLIWFVPMLVSVLLTGGLAGATVYSLTGAEGAFAVAKETGTVLCVLTIVFLLVYHLVLIAVMVSGNVLNAIVSMCILGTGVICIYGMEIGFMAAYLDTFYETGENVLLAAYASPLVAATYLLGRAVDRTWEPVSHFINCMADQALIAAAMGVCAFLLYKKRPSELAEQGIRNRWLSALMRILSGIVAGMGGWLLFVLLVEDGQAVGWGIFGAVLFTVLVMGVLDMIFSMEFKAFLAHWAQMAGTVVVVVLLSFAFCFDWMGYDTYLPDQEDIVQMAVYDPELCNRTNRHAFSRIEEVLRDMQYEDAQAAYAFLEQVTARQKSGADPVQGSRDEITVRVSLKNGRSYYRIYEITAADRQVLAPIICSQAYLEQNYLFDIEEMVSEDLLGALALGKGEKSISAIDSREEICKILEAYNLDCLEDPRVLVGEGGRNLLDIRLLSPDVRPGFNLTVCESMQHTIEALEEAGWGDWVADLDPGEVAWIELPLGSFPAGRDWSREELVALARQTYGVDGVQGEETKEEGREIQSQESMESYKEGELELTITDPDHIRTLLGLVSYEDDGDSIYQRDVIRLYYEREDRNGYLYLEKGKLPEEILLLFGELAK